MEIGQRFVTSFINLPDDIIIYLFKDKKIKLKMIIIFPWLSEFVPMCEFCKVHKSCFVIKFNIIYVKDIKKSEVFGGCNECLYMKLDPHKERQYICKPNCIDVTKSVLGSLTRYNINKNFELKADYIIRDYCIACDTNKTSSFHIYGTHIQLRKN